MAVVDLHHTRLVGRARYVQGGLVEKLNCATPAINSSVLHNKPTDQYEVFLENAALAAACGPTSEDLAGCGPSRFEVEVIEKTDLPKPLW